MLYEIQSTPGCTICPSPIYIFTDVDGIDKYIVVGSDKIPQPITQACCKYINNNSGNAEWIATAVSESSTQVSTGGYCKANFCDAVVFDGNINSVETTQECCEEQGFYWNPSNGRCYKCNPNVGTQNVFINGIETTEYITYSQTKETNSVTSNECCELIGGTLVVDENGNNRCIIPPKPILTACRYTLMEGHDWVLDWTDQDSDGDGQLDIVWSPVMQTSTFTMTEFLVNGTNVLSGPISYVLSSANVNIVNGRYTNFVDWLNTVFQNLGLTDYKAVLSQENGSDGSSVTISPLGEEAGGSQWKMISSFYIVRPQSDTFKMTIDETGNNNQTVAYYDNKATEIRTWNGITTESENATYFQYSCNVELDSRGNPIQVVTPVVRWGT